MMRLVCAAAAVWLLAGCQAAPERHVALDGEPNFRDIGGYATTDGRTVATGKVYRSGRLSSLTDEDVERLDDLEIDLVVNFLTDEEVQAAGEDRLPEGTELRMMSIDAEDMAGMILEARRTGDFSTVPVEMNAYIHEMLPGDAREEYAALFREIADPERDVVVFHCSHGVHRTGTAAAILLWSLGVPWESVREDYLLSNEYRRAATERRLGELRGLAARNQNIDPADVDMTNIRAFYVLEGSYIDATRDWILAEYGSIDAYMTDGLGLSADEVDALRAALLVDGS